MWRYEKRRWTAIGFVNQNLIKKQTRFIQPCLPQRNKACHWKWGYLPLEASSANFNTYKMSKKMEKCQKIHFGDIITALGGFSQKPREGVWFWGEGFGKWNAWNGDILLFFNSIWEGEPHFWTEIPSLRTLNFGGLVLIFIAKIEVGDS